MRYTFRLSHLFYLAIGTIVVVFSITIAVMVGTHITVTLRHLPMCFGATLSSSSFFLPSIRLYGPQLACDSLKLKIGMLNSVEVFSITVSIFLLAKHTVAEEPAGSLI